MANVRKLGQWMCISLVMGNMIGSGVFMVPATLAPYGWLAIAAWLFTTAGAVVLALQFARLARLFPKVGGPYAYSREAYGDFVGFQAGWGYWISIWAGNAAIAVALVGYLGHLVPHFVASPTVTAGWSIVFVWLLSGVNVLGIRQAGWVQLITTILKLAPLVLIAAIGIFFTESHHFTPNLEEGKSSFDALLSAGAITLWAFLGLESATIPADNVENPERTIPRATIIGVLATAVVYILGSIAVIGVVPPEDLANNTAPYAEAARILFGPVAGAVVAVGAVIATLGALNGWTLLGGQVPLAMAKDRLMPAQFLNTSKGGGPIYGVVFSSLIVTVLLLMNTSASLAKTFEFVALLSTLTCLVPYLYCACAEWLLRIRGKTPGPMDTKGRILTVLGFAYVLWAIAGSGQQVVYVGFLFIASGIPLYVWIIYQKGKP